MALRYILHLALAVVAAACSGDCLADKTQEQLALVQRQASAIQKHQVGQQESEAPCEHWCILDTTPWHEKCSYKEACGKCSMCSMHGGAAKLAQDETIASSAMMELAADGTIRVASKPGMCLNAAGVENQAGDQIILFACEGTPNEQFEFRETDSSIRVKAQPELCFNVDGGALTSDANIILWQCTGAENEKFVVFGNTIRPANAPGMCLNAKGGTFNAGDHIILWPCQGTANEKFTPHTDSPTPSPTPAPAECQSWCQYDTRAWTTKCGYNPCVLCEDCGVTAGSCKLWCYWDTRPWNTKCSWTGTCSGCSGCS